jgi:membrane-bound lytic murein transglycosylase D
MQLSSKLLGAFILISFLGLGSCSSVRTRGSSGSAPAGDRSKTGTVKLLPGMRETRPTDLAQNDQPVPESVPGVEPKDAVADPEHLEDDILGFEEKAESQKAENEAEDATEESDDDLEPPVKASKKHDIPFAFNQKVAAWIQYFSQRDRERFQRFLDRGEPYREAVENILEENNVPIDLYYLGMIESGFNFRAKSHAKAVGVWQFMRSTGKMYGLGVDAYVDERKDPIRATEAAAKHLRDLYREFKSWYLAMAAYNAGSGRIRGAVRRGKTNDFWELVQKRVLPRETMEYVPKFLAARYIGENPDLFAFYINEEKKYPNVELVKVPSPLRFSTIEKTCNIPSGELSFVNPHYVQDYTHPGQKTDEIWVPEAYSKTVASNYSNLQGEVIHIKPIREAKVSRARAAVVPVYVVRRGDSLQKIARKRGLSVAYLKRVNGLRSSKVLPGQRLKLAATSYQQKRSHPRRQKRRK